jgi:hypothetical protein
MIQVITSLLTYVPRGYIHQPMDEGQPGNSHGGSSLEGDPPRGPPFNPPIVSFIWLTLDRTCLYHHGINHLLCNLYQNQQPSDHTRSYNTQPMSKTLI